MELKEFILERFSPVVMVISSPEVDAMVGGANGLTVPDLLRPHGFLRHLSAPVRTVGEHAYRIRELCLRFYASSTIYQPSEEAADEFLKTMLTEVAKQSNIDNIPDALSRLKKGEMPALSPWFEKYRSEFHRVLAFAEHETFDHPVACLLVLGSDVPDLERSFSELYRTAVLPPLMEQGHMECKILRHHLVLHDDSTHDEAAYLRAEEGIKGVKAILGANSVHLLRINSRKSDFEQSPGMEALWRTHIRDCLPGGGAGEGKTRPPVPPGGLGAQLTPENLEDIRHFLEAFVVRSLLPSLEARVRALNHQVTSTRKGIRNQLKTLLFRKSAQPETPRAGQALQYGPNSVEGQMRLLADLAFMMQDYDTAISTLRLLSSDYKADKAWRLYASAQEMLGLALFVGGAAASMSEVVALFKDAFYRYNSGNAGSSPRENVRYATRAMLLLAAYCRQHSLYGEANYALMKAHFQEENLRAALLLEAAAQCLLHMSPPAIRKFAFHMVLAGLRYNACDQKQLGVAAYRQVLQVYAGRRWSFIEEHLNDVLGKAMRESGQLDGALRHFMSMLASRHSSEYWQSYYLRQFLEVVHLAQQRPEGAPVLELPLPEIDSTNVQAYFDNQICYASSAARAVPEAEWRALEAPLLQGSNSRLSSLWLDPGGSRANLLAPPTHTSVVGEAITLQVPISNPLVLDLHLSSMELLYEHSGGTSSSSNEYVQVDKQELSMRPGEKVVLSLRIVPKKVGQVTVTGMEWLLNGAAQGRRALAPRPVRRRSSRPDLQTPADSLTFNVIDARPCLKVEVEDLPEDLVEGELHPVTLLISNVSRVALQGIRAVVKSPDLHLGPQGTLGPSSSPREVKLDNPGFVLPGGGTLYVWPTICQLPAGEVMRWPAWILPSRPGRLSLLHLWAYEAAADIKDPLRNRSLRVVTEVEVRGGPSFSARLPPARTDSRLFLLRLLLHSPLAIDVRRLTCTSPHYRLTPLSASAELDGAASIPVEVALSAGSRGTFTCCLHPVPSVPAAHTPLTPGEDAMEGLSPEVAHFHRRRRTPVRALLQGNQQDGGPAKPEFGYPGGAPSGSMVRANDFNRSERTPSGEAGPSFVVEWDLDGGARRGVTHLLRVTEEEGEGLRAVVKGAEQIRHDFRQDSLCRADIRLLLRNCSSGATFICVEAGVPSPAHPHDGGGAWRALASSQAGASPLPSPLSGGHAPTFGPSPAQGYMWCGKTCTHVPALEKDREVELPLQIAVFAPGLYEVTDYVVHWGSTEDGQAAKGMETMPGPRFLLSVQAG